MNVKIILNKWIWRGLSSLSKIPSVKYKSTSIKTLRPHEQQLLPRIYA